MVLCRRGGGGEGNSQESIIYDNQKTIKIAPSWGADGAVACMI